MYNVFNMGIGFTLVVDQQDVAQTLDILKAQGMDAYEIGHTYEGTEGITLEGVQHD